MIYHSENINLNCEECQIYFSSVVQARAPARACVCVKC